MSKVTWVDPTRPDEEMDEEHFMAKVWNQSFDDQWTMTLDITEMCRTAGTRDKYYDGAHHIWRYFIVYSFGEMRKALKLIRRYGDPELIDRTQEYLDAKFPRWGEVFRKTR